MFIREMEVLMRVYPHFYIDIGLLLCDDSEDTLYDDLATPDAKMYYPEPFVASPSFVHEDI